jgi:hypothetical protein
MSKNGLLMHQSLLIFIIRMHNFNALIKIYNSELSMSSFYVSDLDQPLFALAIASYVLLIVWAEIRRQNPRIITIAQSFNDQQRRGLSKGRQYRLLLLGMISVILCFTSSPYIYQFLMPIKALDIPFLNFTGLALIAVSLVWTSVMQLEFDQILYKHAPEQKDTLSLAISSYGKEIQLGYFAVMLGVAIVLANAVSLILLSIACFISYRNRQLD